MSMNIADYPHQKKESRTRFYSQLSAETKSFEVEVEEMSAVDKISRIEMKLRAALGQ